MQQAVPKQKTAPKYHFISGLPRSGSTLLAPLLAHSRLPQWLNINFMAVPAQKGVAP